MPFSSYEAEFQPSLGKTSVIIIIYNTKKTSKIAKGEIHKSKKIRQHSG